MVSLPDKHGYFGDYGGRFVSELLMPALIELEKAYSHFSKDKKFQAELKELLEEYAGRPTRLYFARNLSEKLHAEIFLKREDLLHTGAHKINNTLGQVLLASKMNKKRIIAETGAGQHGVATATASALFHLKCKVYMGNEDLRRQELNAFRMELLGAEIEGTGGPKGTLRDAINEALRDWSKTVGDTHYVIGSVVGPHPFPSMVRDFQSVIGKEARKQILSKAKKLPDAVIACVGGGSNAMGLFTGFLHDNVRLFGVEAGGHSSHPGDHSMTLSKGSPGILHGAKSYLLQNEDGLVQSVHSVSAGLDYPGVGPQHAFLKDSKRAEYISVNDKEALTAFQELARLEGIIPALESSHAVAGAFKIVRKLKKEGKSNPLIIINISGRGDKDVAEARSILKHT